MSKYELEFLEGRLGELESAADNLMFMLENEESAFYGNELMKMNLAKCLTESAAVRRRLAEVKRGE
jgi:hypothetical protein